MRTPIHTKLLTSVLFMAVGSTAGPAFAQADVDSFRAQMEKWVETRQIISEEESDWAVDREYLKATRDLLEQEKTTLVAEIEALRESNTAADEERRVLLLQRGEYQRASATLADEIRSMEELALAQVPRLPEPLQKKLDPLLVQIPSDPTNSKLPLGQRLMSVLGVLAQVEKFNSTATFVGETRSLGGDRKVQVRTLYWGLGQAVYVDSQGTEAGIGRPGTSADASGWEFSSQPELTADARQLLDIYEGNVDDIEFVVLPVEIR
jgi:hypothetical protein